MSNPNELERRLQALVGRDCKDAGYSDKFYLRLVFSTDLMLIVAPDVAWEVVKPDGTIITNDHPQAEESLDWVEDEVKAAVLDPETFGLFLLFASDASLYVAPSPDDGLRQGPSWRLTLPDGSVDVGPGTKWNASQGQ